MRTFAVLPLNDHFDGLLKNLNPPEDRQALAEKLPPIVRDHLEKSDCLATVEESPVSASPARMGGGPSRATSTTSTSSCSSPSPTAASPSRTCSMT